MLEQIKKYHTGTVIFTLVAAFLAFHYLGVAAMLAVLTLGLIETCVSLDNAVVNMSVLKNWDAKWQKLFLWFGMPVAVFGMRFLLPLVIVSVAAGVSLTGSFNLALNSPVEYGNIIKSVHQEIAAFGGMFLLCITAGFFLDPDKENHLLPLEDKLVNISPFYVVFAGLVALAAFLPWQVFMAGLLGASLFYLIHLLADKMSDGIADGVIKQGIVGLLYLELLDASFSLDGVIAAFAVSSNIFVIALGLGIGAMFVRSFTLQLLDNPKVSEMKYLEHGAFLAIGCLVVIMAFSMFVHVNEFLAAAISMSCIGYGLYKSVQENKHVADAT